MDFKRLFSSIDDADRLRKRSQLEAQQRYDRGPHVASYQGPDPVFGQTLLKSSGQLLRSPSHTNIQPEVDSVGLYAGGFDVGVRKSPLIETRRKLIDTIAQVYFVLEGFDLVAYFVGDKTSLKEIHRSEAPVIRAEAQLRFDLKSKPDITLIYFYPTKRRLVWIRGGTLSDVEIPSETLTQAKVLGYGIYGPPTAIFQVNTRRLTRSRITDVPIIPPTYRLQPYILGAESQALPTDAIASRPALNFASIRPDVDFTLISENALTSPPSGDPASQINYFFTSEFQGIQRYHLAHFTDTGTVDVTMGTTNYSGSFQTPEFYVDNNNLIQPSAPSNFAGFSFVSGVTVDFPSAPTVLKSSAMFAFLNIPIAQDELQGVGVATDLWTNIGFLDSRTEFLGQRLPQPNAAGFRALCTVQDDTAIVLPLNFDGSHPNYSVLVRFPNFYGDRTLWYYTQQPDKSWQEVKAIVSELGDLAVTVRLLTIANLKQEPPMGALYKSDYAVNPYKLGG